MDTRTAPQNIQDAFLNATRREKETITVFLMNGAKLTGRIRSFDKFSLLLESGQQEHLIFKHAISTILHTRRATGEYPNVRPSHTANDGQTQDTGE